MRLRLTVASLCLTSFVALVHAAPSAARDTSLKVLFQSTHWFCHLDPTGWPLADFKAVCSQIEPGGKGQFVEFILDRNGRMRRKPVTKPKPADLRLRGTFA